MLNEAFTIYSSLTRHNVPVRAAHPWVKRLGRSDLLILGLDREGYVRSIEFRGKDEAVLLSKVQASNHNNFPAVNYGDGLWKLDSAQPTVAEWRSTPKKDIASRLRLLRAACSQSALSSDAHEFLAKVRRFVVELQLIFSKTEEEFQAFRVLLDRFLLASVGSERWFSTLTEAAFAAAEEEDAFKLDAIELLMAGDAKKKAVLLFDLADCLDFEHRVADPAMADFYSRSLLAGPRSSSATGICGLTGNTMEIERGKLPNPRLPVLADTVLMSMNPDTPCQYRYGHIGPEVFPVGKKTAEALNSALLQITLSDREHKNWQRVPAAKRGKTNLLIAYLRDAPLLDLEIADLFSDRGTSDASYTDVTRKVFDALRGRASPGSDLIELLVLNKISPGQVQVELSRSFSADQVVRGGGAWEEGSKNRPEITLPHGWETPFPSDLVWCTRLMWIRGGTATAEVTGCDLAQVFDLLVADSPGAQRSARRLLDLLTTRTGPLLIALAHACHRHETNIWTGVAREAERCVTAAVAGLAISLYKLNLKKEDYMKEKAFLLGRFLSLVDTLHYEYCVTVREKQIPPQLLGNSLIPVVVNNAANGLAHVLDRIRVYQAWAKRAGTGLARWALAELGAISPMLSSALLEQRLDAPAKAQLLLGYLARSERKEAKESTVKEGEE